jgi:trehalose synthase
MKTRLKDYEAVVGKEVIDELRVLAGHLAHKKLQHINSTAVGGGVAEILTRMVPMLQELGVDTSWDVIKGDEAFFKVTKSFHNALQGAPQDITREMLDAYVSTTEQNLQRIQIKGDVIFVHDPQPAGLIALKKRSQGRWVWRCHIDVSSPDPKAWAFLRSYVQQYDAAIFSMPDFAQQLSLPQFMIPPSIDPLSDKNKDLDEKQVQATLTKYGLDPSRPILTQVSRFDRLKDPVGVIAAYRIAKARRDCQLVLAGGSATDDPEGAEVLNEVREAAKNDPDIHILLLPPFSDLDINALVRGSTVILQKSVREGFGLTVTEALWKRKPVIGGAVGGIRTQILDGVTGFLVHSPEGAAHRMLQLLSDQALREHLGANGYLHVKQNFLLTRHVKDYILVMLALDHRDEDIVYLDTLSSAPARS